MHGVLNTDNMSILGLTIDYGPYGWIDNFDPEWTPNTTDREHRRYRFGQQPAIAFWNLSRLAGALMPVFESVEPLQQGLARFTATYARLDRENCAGKLGLLGCSDADLQQYQTLHGLLQAAEVDMTIFFRELACVDAEDPQLDPLLPAFYNQDTQSRSASGFDDWLQTYAARLRSDNVPVEQRRARMRAINPQYVLRNYLAQEAIDRAEQGDYQGIHDLLQLLRRPYQSQPGREALAARRPDWARNRAGCSMLSCSS